jgi:hypothetical protein
MSGAIPPLPNTPSWRGTQLRKAQGQLNYCLCVCSLVSFRILLLSDHTSRERVAEGNLIVSVSWEVYTAGIFISSNNPVVLCLHL